MKRAAPPRIPGLVFVQPLGSGGYADVYLYEQQTPRMPVAVKVLRAEGLTDTLREQLGDEANTMAQLGDHPYIVQVFRSGTSEDGRPYLVMKYYPGDNLAKRSRAERFTVEEVLRTGIQLASAVETAHRAHITHRDIKPANVLVSAYGQPGLTDFGIAGRGLRDSDVQPETTDGIGVSVPWAPPEVLYGQSSGDERSDVYSLAATLWQLLVGRSPFEVPGGDNSAYALMPRIRANPVPPTGRADVPPGLERLLAQAMAKDPTHRPGTALELARGLQAVEQQERLARTPIVVLDEQGHTTLLSQLTAPPADVAVDEDRTRVKAPQTVHAQPEAPAERPAARPTDPDEATRRREHLAQPAPVPAAPAGQRAAGPVRASAVTDPTTSHTSPLPADADEPTVRRPSVTTAERPGATEPATPARTPALLLGLGTMVLALVGVIAFLLLRPSEPETPTASAPPSPTVSMPGDDSAIGNAVFEAPALEARRGPGTVTFTWSYAAPLESDSYVLFTGPTSSDAQRATPLQVKTRTHTVKVAAGTQVCALVKVNRSGQASPASEPKCETAS